MTRAQPRWYLEKGAATYSIVPVDPDEEVMVGKGAEAGWSGLSYGVGLHGWVSPGRLVAERDRVAVLDAASVSARESRPGAYTVRTS